MKARTPAMKRSDCNEKDAGIPLCKSSAPFFAHKNALLSIPRPVLGIQFQPVPSSALFGCILITRYVRLSLALCGSRLVCYHWLPARICKPTTANQPLLTGQPSTANLCKPMQTTGYPPWAAFEHICLRMLRHRHWQRL